MSKFASTANGSNGRRKRTRWLLASWLTSDKALLHIFLASVLIVSISIFIVPLTLEDPVDYASPPAHHQHHSVTTQLKKESTSAKPKEKKNANVSVASDTNSRNEKSDNKESFFHTHSTPYHTIFSTGCSIFQDWQSYVFFYHVFRSGQEGHITRIASGCDVEDEMKIKELFAKEIESMSPDRHHHLHLTPDFSRVPKMHPKPFKYFNKPYGVRHWMEHALGYPDNHELHDDSIIILMDPDQIMLRPFTNDFTNSSEKWKLKEPRYKLKVEHGSPFSQQYGYGLQWMTKVNPETVFRDGKLPTPVSNMTRKEGYDYFTGMGPPYIATAKDMWAIANVWSDIAPNVYDEYPFLLAEMFAFNLAAAHLGLRHTVAHSFMVSDPWAGGEGWPLIDKVPESNICKNFPKSEYPHVIHYCQRYYLGKWFIGKYKLRKDFISCEAPLLMQPPDDLASKYNTSILPETTIIKEWKPKQAKEEAFMICAMIDALNAASTFYKDQHCKNGSGNYNYSYVFHEEMRMPEEII